jgi:hypothetical protein
MKSLTLLSLFLLQSISTATILRHHSKDHHAKISQKKKDNSILRFLTTKAHDDFKMSSESDLKPQSHKVKTADKITGGVIRFHKPKDTKPLYIDMSPIYDYRNY